MQDAQKRADELLAEIAELNNRLGGIERAAQRDLEQVRREFEIFTAPIKEELQQSGKELMKLMKKNREEIFAEGPRLESPELTQKTRGELFEEGVKVSLPHGFLLWEKGTRLVIPKGTVERLEELGWEEALKVAKSVDREVVAGWPEEKLYAIGAERNPSEKFNYEAFEMDGRGK